MTAILETSNESLKLSGISWETYTHLLDDLSKQHRLRLTYIRLWVRKQIDNQV